MSYPELEQVVEAVYWLEQWRRIVSEGTVRGLPDDELEGTRRGAQKAVMLVEEAAVDLAQSETLRRRVEAAGEELIRRRLDEQGP